MKRWRGWRERRVNALLAEKTAVKRAHYEAGAHVSAQLQLALEEPLVFVACDRFGRPRAGRCRPHALDEVWHEASLWCYVAAKTSRLPAPAVGDVPVLAAFRRTPAREPSPPDFARCACGWSAAGPQRAGP